MTYPPSGGTPDPYEPQQPHGQSPDPTTPYAQDPYAAPASGQPGAYVAPEAGQPGAYPPPSYDPNAYGPNSYGADPYGANPYGTQQPYPAYGPQARTNGLAVASLACSLGGLITCISAPVGIVLGHIAKRQIRQTGEQGEGMATAGLWVGYILTILGFLFAAGWVVFFIVLANTSTSTY
jgi:Domain of unknown function (DUF4190)